MLNDIATGITALDRITTGVLAERYAKLHGQPCHVYRKQLCAGVPVVGGRSKWYTI
jgi:hypothetical protein